ncbi:MAG: DUF4912 domain-containing protein [Nitrospirota bacterium]
MKEKASPEKTSRKSAKKQRKKKAVPAEKKIKAKSIAKKDVTAKTSKKRPKIVARKVKKKAEAKITEKTKKLKAVKPKKAEKAKKELKPEKKEAKPKKEVKPKKEIKPVEVVAPAKKLKPAIKVEAEKEVKPEEKIKPAIEPKKPIRIKDIIIVEEEVIKPGEKDKVRIKEEPRKVVAKEVVRRHGKRIEIVPEILPPSFPKEEAFAPVRGLPLEYGENSVTLLMVDPYKIFSFWEVREDTLRIFKGKLTLRVYDVTDISLDKIEESKFYDIAVGERIGKYYINVSPSREFVTDIGVFYDGIFITVARSNRVATPRVIAPEPRPHEIRREIPEEVPHEAFREVPPEEIPWTDLSIGY